MSAQEFIEAALGGAITTSVAAYERDIDHAVALEREAIAVWLEGITIDHAVWINELGRGVIAMTFDGTPQDLIDAIRNGAHHANTPPNAQERG